MVRTRHKPFRSGRITGIVGDTTVVVWADGASMLFDTRELDEIFTLFVPKDR
jgi:hypothetical protein